ncbi:hypothetical protein BD410DRAFT_899056 [Rickenella mellea]|uniref:F-box domain-containing protein n=1 Tax=Rickenella mellea TaxID=50990 RepID=A0A4Y7Q1Y4_9AGAM|nr:hypothetical protein BD410DRAFT_899056 [Rickenella mellea]
MFEKPYRAVRKLLLCDLPDELLVKILLNLDGYSLLQAQQINVRLCKLIRDEKALQYSLELSIAGMEDGPENAPFTVEERMARLKDYVSAWEGLRCQGEETFTVRNPSIWAVTGGLVSYGEISVQTGTTKLVFRKLPSRTRDIADRTWIHEVPVAVQLFTADLSRDLFVFGSARPSTPSSVSLRIGFNHISTGRRHTQAKHPFIDHEVPFEFTEPTIFEVLVCQTYMAVSCKEFIDYDGDNWEAVRNHFPKTSFFVYDWLTGELIFQITDHIQDFTFLSDKDVLLLVTPKAPPYAYMLVVVDINNQHSPERCSVTTSLLLPELVPHLRDPQPDVSVHSRPQFTPMGGFATSDRIPFRTASESRILAIRLEFEPSWPPVVFVPLLTIKPFMNSEMREVSRLSECAEQSVPWEVWGANGSTRVMEAPMSDVCCTWGSRCIFFRSTFLERWRIRAERVKICDFNLLSLKRRMGTTEFQQTDAPSPGLPRLVLDPNTIAKGTYFEESVTTSLPYWVDYAGMSETLNAFILEDHIVFVHGFGPDVDKDDVYTLRVSQIS